MRYLIFLQLVWLILISSCGGGAGGVGQFLAKGDAPSVSSVDFVNDQLVINGSNLAGVTSVSVEGENFNIESISNNQLVVNAQQALAFIAGASYNLLVSNAFGAATYSITFTPDNNSITTNMIVDSAVTSNKIADEAITESKLSDMGASDGDFLQWDQTTTSWIPTTLNGLTYLGTWDATTAAPADPNAGEYYVISVAGDTDLGTQTAAWSVGDWAIYNGSDWQKIDNSNAVTNVFGRQGAITGVEGDYNIDLLGDVDTTTATPADGQVLSWDQAGGNWVPTTESDPKVGTLTNGKWCTSDGNVINCESAPGAETDPIFAAHVASSISNAGSGIVISVAERNGITNNATNISTNVSNISSNDTDIATNVTNISTNATNISSNDTDIATNVTNISTNATNISSNDTDIATNVTNISTNATNISSNDTDIATNVTNISTNATNISSNDTDIAANATAISGKVTAAGEAGGQTIIGGTGNDENLTLIASSAATPGVIYLNPNGGGVGVGVPVGTPPSMFHVMRDGAMSHIQIESVNYNNAGLTIKNDTNPGQSAFRMQDPSGDMAFFDWRSVDNSSPGLRIGTTSSDANARIRFNIGGLDAAKMTIKSTGYVGIGSADPAAKLDVVGAINAEQLCDETGSVCHDLSTGAITGDISASGGNVSVGTTDSTYNITFEGDTDQTIGVLEQSSGAGSSLTINSGAAQSGSTDQAGGNLILSSGSSTGNAGSAIEFKTASSSGTPGSTATATPSTKMVILEDGSVGIGTTTPVHMLEINDTGSPNGTMQITRSAAPFIRFKSGSTGVARLQAPTTSTMSFSDYNGVNNYFVVNTSSGNVGVGSTEPAYPLDINGTGIRVQDSAGDPFIRLDGASTASYLSTRSNGADMAIVTGGVDQLTVKNSGSVGIGTIDPDQALTVEGGKLAVRTNSIDITNNYDFYIQSDVAVSDDRSGMTITSQRALNFVVDSQDEAATYPFRWLSQTTNMFEAGDTNELMRLTTDGKLGIGTNNPGAKLDSSGEIFIRSAVGGALPASAGEGLKLEYSSGYDIGIIQGYDYSTSTASDISLQTSGGNVGIGTNDPGASLHLFKNDGTDAKMVIENDGTGNTGVTVKPADTAAAYLELGNARTGNGYAFIDLTGDATYTDYGLRMIRSNTGENANSSIEHRGTGEFTIKANDAGSIGLYTSNTKRLSINSSGDVGIGAKFPSAKLVVSEDITSTDNRFEVAAAVMNAVIYSGGGHIHRNGNASGIWTTYGFTSADIKVVVRSTGAEHFFTAGAVNPDNMAVTDIESTIPVDTPVDVYLLKTAVVIDEDGDLGIGVANPSYPLHVQNKTAGQGAIVAKSSIGTTLGFFFEDVTTNAGELYLRDNTDANQVRISSDGDSYLNGGSVGIGTTNPSGRLEISSGGTILDIASQYGTDSLVIQALTGGRDETKGAALEFAIPANTDGSNVYTQGRIMTVPGNSSTGNATGKMILGTKRYFNKNSLGNQWYFGDDLTIDGAGNVGIGTTAPAAQLEVTGDVKHNYLHQGAYTWTDWVAYGTTSVDTGLTIPAGMYKARVHFVGDDETVSPASTQFGLGYREFIIGHVPGTGAGSPNDYLHVSPTMNMVLMGNTSSPYHWTQATIDIKTQTLAYDGQSAVPIELDFSSWAKAANAPGTHIKVYLVISRLSSD